MVTLPSQVKRHLRGVVIGALLLSLLPLTAVALASLDEPAEPPLALDVQGVITAPGEPLGAPLSHFLPTPKPKKVYTVLSQPVRLPVASSGRCGGSLPSCSVMMCESKGNIRARNPRSSAAGKWQITHGTWGGYGGYSSADQAPEETQDARARELWAGGNGRGHWQQCL